MFDQCGFFSAVVICKHRNVIGHIYMFTYYYIVKLIKHDSSQPAFEIFDQFVRLQCNCEDYTDTVSIIHLNAGLNVGFPSVKIICFAVQTFSCVQHTTDSTMVPGIRLVLH